MSKHRLFRFEGERWYLRVGVPRSWIDRPLAALLQRVAAVLRARRDLVDPAVWVPRAAELDVLDDAGEPVARDAPLSAVFFDRAGGEVVLRRRDARAAPDAVLNIDADALALALEYAFARADQRRVCKRFAEAVGGLLDRVTCDGPFDAPPLARAFPRATAVSARRAAPTALVAAVSAWASLASLDVRDGDLDDAALARVLGAVAPSLRALDASRTGFGRLSLRACRSLALEALDVSETPAARARTLDAPPTVVSLAAARSPRCGADATFDDGEEDEARPVRGGRFRALVLDRRRPLRTGLLRGPGAARLRSLSLADCGVDDGVLTLLHGTRLRYLDVGRNPDISDLGLCAYVAAAGGDLRHLGLGGNQDLGERCVAALAACAPRLEALDVELLWRLTAEPLVALVLATALSRVYLHGCGSVSRAELRDRAKKGGRDCDAVAAPRGNGASRLRAAWFWAGGATARSG